MDTSRKHGLGLRTEVPFNPEAILSTAPASPTEDMPNHKPFPALEDDTSTAMTTSSYTMPPPQSTVAQLSFGPATQQTVTTVTTTTTISLPPLVMNPPKDLHERDPKHYPLAFTPTPKYLKKFCVDVNGRPIRFQEEEDAQKTVRKHSDLQEKIRRHNGSIRSEQKIHEDYHTPDRGTQIGKSSVHNVRASDAPKRSATPPSIAEAAELASLQRRMKKPRSSLHKTHAEVSEFPSLNQRAAAGEIPGISNLSPITPDPDAGVVSMLPPKNTAGSDHSKKRARLSHPRLQELQHAEDDEDDVQMAGEDDEDSQLGPPFYGTAKSKKKRSVVEDGSTGAGASQSRGGAAATPPIMDSDPEPIERSHHRPNLPSILTNSSQQDASLPSPSLSPITAAANLASRRDAFGVASADQDESTLSTIDLENDSGKTEQHFSFEPAHTQHSKITTQPQQYQHPSTLMDIPHVLNAFDSLPEAMQSYVLYQFLRRSTKASLRMVADVVNPALKCDPFSMLPNELGQSIVRFLDVKSMCRASQVSTRWRKTIDGDEWAWRALLVGDAFWDSAAKEIGRAVREGWGWQFGGEDGAELDLSKHAAKERDGTGSFAATVISDDEETASVVARTTKKRSHHQHLHQQHQYGKSASSSNGIKKLKRRHGQPSSSATKPSSTSTSTSSSRIHRLLDSAQGSGPRALADSAEKHVPFAQGHLEAVGLPSLKNMHLFKSLYRRHYLIRRAWMSPQQDTASGGAAGPQPQHLAFRAHHRHVVTCLLFDDERILTGSDDTKICVYDTKTGALKNRLEGHEGGVWALQDDGDTLVSGSTDRSVRVWSISSGRCLQTFQGHTSTVRCLVILKPVKIGISASGEDIMMPKEPLIITGSRDSTLRVWKLPAPGDRQVFQTGPPANDRDNPYFLRTLSGHHNSVRAIAAHGDTLISGSYDCTVRVWKISTGDLLHRLQGHTQKVYSVVLDHERGRCISGSMDNLVKVWDLASGSCIFNLEGHTSLVGLLDLSHNRLVSAAADSTLRIWDPDTGACRHTLSAHTGAITCFQHDDFKVLSGSDRCLKMWDVRTGECARDLLAGLSGVWQVRFDERRVVGAVQRGGLTFVEVLDFGAARDGIPASQRGRRIVVDARGREIEEVEPVAAVEVDDGAEDGAEG